MSPQREFGNLFFWISNTSQFEIVLPILKDINRPSIVLCTSDVRIENSLPDNIFFVIINYTHLYLNTSHYCSKVEIVKAKLERTILTLFDKVIIDGAILFESQTPIDSIILDIIYSLGIKIISLKFPSTHSYSKSASNLMDGILTPQIINNSGTYTEIINSINKTMPLSYNTSIRRLNLGCGQAILKNWINVDLFITNHHVLTMDIGKIFPFKDETFDLVFSEHTIEHLEYSNQRRMFLECFRVLKPGGIIRIATPNFKFLLDLYENPKAIANREYINWCITNFDYSHIDDIEELEKKGVLGIYIINKFMRSWGHKFIHTPESLLILARKVGFTNAKRCLPGNSIHSKLNNLEKHQYIIPSWANNIETMVYEFTKPSK